MSLYLGNSPIGNIATTFKSYEHVSLPSPAISVDQTGLITSTVTQTESGLIQPSQSSATHQLPTQNAQTITPGTSDQTISANQYLTGVQTVKGDTNLQAGNIVSGVTIFGVSGSVVTQDYYTGYDVPSNTLGKDGDLYFMKG